jgi:outer membrane protein OmpA-like peptidoglycan-associated protein
MRKNWLLLILATVIVTLQYDANAQSHRMERYRNKANDPVSGLSYDKKLRWADNLYRQGSYFNAIDYYQQLKQEQERNPYLTLMLATCYEMTRDYEPAAHYYAEAYSLASKLYPEALFREALMEKQAGEYEKAIATFNRFISENPKTYKKLKKYAKVQIDGCTMAMTSMKDPQPQTIINAGPNVNSAYTESAPYPLGDTALLFSSMRQNEVIDANPRARGEYMSRFMVSHKQGHVSQVDSFEWPMKFMDGKFNQDNVHVGNGCFSPGGDRFYFTKCGEGDSNSVNCKIYVSEFKGKEWTKPETLGEGINDGPSNSQPWICKIGKKEILFFSSNRKLQSRGGYDIWYSVYDTRRGTYRRPQNAGKQVNTEYDEITPYYDSRVGKLYFASNGWKGFGGFDIFSADGGPSRYTNVQNLGYPINTSADELYYIKDPLGKPDAYVVSNRVGAIALKNPTCCDDIWRIQYEPKLMVIGKVVDRKSGEKLSDAVVKMVNQNSDMKTYNSTDGDFSFNIARGNNYVITGDKQGYSSTRATINTMDVKRTDPDDTVYVTIYMDSVVIDFSVTNVFYDFDKATLRPESMASLDSLVNFMKDNPSLSVEIYSYTDSKGSNKYNEELSKRRAQSVVDYLVQHGIEDQRLVAKGFGDKMPVAPNKIGRKDNPEGRQLNRRTEFRIVTDVPSRRILFNSAKPGTMDEQSKNLQVDENDMNDGDPNDQETEMSKPGYRVNKGDNNP